MLFHSSGRRSHVRRVVSCSFACVNLSLLGMAMEACAALDKPLEPIVVQATRFPQPMTDFIGDVSVLTREDIASSGATSLLQLLRQLPGVQVVQTGGVGKPMSVFLRGANANHTLLLIDGMRVGSATLGLAPLQNIPLEQIARIEVLRGPASVWYGADALGGVISIVTHAAGSEARSHFSVGMGTERTTGLDGGMTGQTDAWRWAWGAGYRSTRGINALANPANDAYNPDRDGYRQGQLSGQADYRFNQAHQTGLSFFLTQAENQYDNSFPTADYDYGNRDTVSTWRWWGKHQWSPIWQSRWQLGQSVDITQSWSPPNPYRFNDSLDTRFQTRQTQLQWHNEIEVATGSQPGLALVDVETLEQAVAGTFDFPVRDRRIHSLTTGYRQKGEQISWQAAWRYDVNSQFGHESTGSIGANYRFNQDWQGGAIYGTSFRAPTFNELYFQRFGNPNLRPEHGKNTELFIRYWGTSVEGSLSLYQNRVRDLVAFTDSFINLSKVKLTGASLAASWRAETIRIGGNIDWLAARNITESSYYDKHLPRRARQQASLYLEKDWGGWQLRSEWFAQGRRYEDVANRYPLGGYSLCNLSLNGPLTNQWRWQLQLNNIFGKQYELARDYGVLGQTAWLSIRYQSGR